MIPEELDITFNNDDFVFEIDDSTGSPRSAWRWIRKRDFTEPAETICSQLVEVLLRTHGIQVAQEATDLERTFLYDVFRDAGASMGQLWEHGFKTEVSKEDLDFGAEKYFDNPPKAGHSFLNSHPLAMDFFHEIETVDVGRDIFLVGEGPFTRDQFQRILGQHDVTFTGELTPDCVMVIGRDSWTETELNDLIEQSGDQTLRVYSQELFLSVVAGFPDPFEQQDRKKRSAGLYGYRAGHPGLEYISNGWLGWVDEFRAAYDRDVRRVTTRRSTEMSGTDQSPLSRLGYQVGINGLGTSERRQILARCFEGGIPHVQDDAYMEKWGDPGSAKRLRRLAQHLVSLVEKTSRRTGSQDYSVALDNWIADLAWLKKSYYYGHMTFSWPHARRAD